MKSSIKIQNGGKQFHPKLADKFIEEILRDKGLKYSEHNNYELWAYPKDNVRFWYILKGVGRKEVVREIKPTHINEYVNESMDKILKILENKEKQLQKLQHEVLQLKTKKRVKEFEDGQRDLNQFIQRKEAIF